MDKCEAIYDTAHFILNGFLGLTIFGVVILAIVGVVAIWEWYNNWAKRDWNK